MAERQFTVERLSQWVLKNRLLVLGIIAVITGFFLYGVTKVEVKPSFTDLLPQNHPYIKTHMEYLKQLGDPLNVAMMLRVNKGDIYNRQTLEKIKRITDQLDFIKGVNHNQIYSIASRKIKRVILTSDSIATEKLMATVPANLEEIEKFKNTVRDLRNVFGIWISRDEKSVLIVASFIPERSDYKDIFNSVREMIKTETDENHTLHAAGNAMLIGWIKSCQNEMCLILSLAFLALFCLLYLYFRNMVGVIVPVISTVLGGIWGLGFCGLLGYDLEPLTLVIPLLITARALSHSVQVTERYFECYEDVKKVIPACIKSTSSILPPGVLGITVDAIGILFIAVAPIPAMQKLAYVCGFWALGIIFTGIIFTPLLISFFQPPKNISKIVDMNKGITQKILSVIAKIGYGKRGVACFVLAVVIGIFSFWVSLKVRVGDINPGTPILWEDSEFNIAVGQINRYFPGTEELYVIVEGKKKKDVERPEVLRLLNSFQRHMERNPLVAATSSVADFLPPIHKSVYGGYPKWEILPEDPPDSAQLFSLLTTGSAPGDYDRYFSQDEKNANVIIWFKDHTGATIQNAISWVKTFNQERKNDIDQTGVRFRLASGTIGILAAIDETVKESQTLNFVLVMGSVFIFCSIAYRSIAAALILMIPLNLANLITLSIMSWMGIGLSINTLPIVSLGVGVGIDYGIYLLSRICEEYKSLGEYSLFTATNSIKTTGKAIFFTGTTMIVAVILWYFLSSLKFQAEMGLLLALVIFINMAGVLILIPSLVYVFKPKFLGKATLLISESTTESKVALLISESTGS